MSDREEALQAVRDAYEVMFETLREIPDSFDQYFDALRDAVGLQGQVDALVGMCGTLASQNISMASMIESLMQDDLGRLEADNAL